MTAYLGLPALVAALFAAVGAWRTRAGGAPDVSLRNPLQLASALQMVVMFQVVLMSVYLLREIWAESGVFTSAAVLGLTDVDALTLSMATGVARTSSPAVAATAIAVGVLANTAMKLTLAMLLGSRRFRLIAGSALTLMLVAQVSAYFAFFNP